MMMPAQSLTVPVNTEFGRYSESVMSNSTLSPRNTPTYKSPGKNLYTNYRSLEPFRLCEVHPMELVNFFIKLAQASKGTFL